MFSMTIEASSEKNMRLKIYVPSNIKKGSSIRDRGSL
jgi:hypothetical protein